MMHIKLPDRTEITLSEAITAFAYGEPRDVSSAPLYFSFPLENLLKLLRDAALTGRVRFRALRAGINKYQEIDPAYFNKEYSFDWNQNLIREFVSSNEVEEYVGEHDIVPVVEWYDVYLNRNQYASLLKDMGISVEPRSDYDAQPAASGKPQVYKTGVAGRPTAINLILDLAQNRLAAKDYADSQKQFAQELADYLAKTDPLAPRMTPKSITNNPKFRELWRKRPK
jgi:hypothetical protein